jgi:uridine phosphorylase
VAHHELVRALVEGASAEGIRFHVGITASTDTFFPGQGRRDSFSRHLLRRFEGQSDELRNLNVLNYEMESATLLTMCAAFGLRGGCVTGVVGDRTQGEDVRPEGLASGEEVAVRVAVAAMRRLVRARRS